MINKEEDNKIDGINVLSLFDGISCARVALERAGIKVDNYYCNEIDKYACIISAKNIPKKDPNIDWKMNQQGGLVEDVHGINGKFVVNGAYHVPIDLLIGGSPCQDLSIAKSKREGLQGKRSGLFREYARILREVRPKRFILENVASMPKEAKDTITNELGVDPIMIDAALVSAQSRKRLFWTNIPGITQPEDRGILLKDIIEDEVDEKYYISNEKFEKLKSFESNARLSPLYGKSPTLNTMQGGHRQPKILTSGKGMNVDVYNTEVNSPTLTTDKGEGVKILQLGKGYNKGGAFEDKSPTLSSNSWQENNKLFDNTRIRKLTPVECERLRGLPDNYTQGVSDTQRYKMLGNAFNVDVIAHILSFMPR